jgi:localization factor PodJL
VPRELEKLLSGLIEKLEWVQLTHTDHAALAHLEDRIAMLIKRFDASDARLGNLDAVERGLADLLVHLEQIRSANGNAAAPPSPPAADSIERDVAEIKEIERRTQDTLEAVQGTVEQVVDRLAMIESDMRSASAPRPEPAMQLLVPTAEAAPSQPAVEPAPMFTTTASEPTPTYREPSAHRAVARRPIDPNLPPDHPLEPGSAAGRPPPPVSAADRIAASEAAVGSSKPPVIPDPAGKSNFIAAARRAAQAAAAAPYDSSPRAESTSKGRLSIPTQISQRMRTLLVAGSAVLIVIFCLHIASRLFVDGGAAPASDATSGKAAPAVAAPTDINPAKLPAPAPAPLPDQSTAPATTPSTTPSVLPGPKSGATTGTGPAQQSSLNADPGQTGSGQIGTIAAPSTIAGQPAAAAMPLWSSPDITGSLPPRRATAAPAATADTVSDNLPAAIGGTTLRAAALAGDASAAYEVAMRFIEGHGVPQSDGEAARWLARAAKQGLAPAQFRLGTFYEKGTGVKKDLAAARDLYLAAADKGNGKAMHNLAVLYAEGINAAPDYRSAVLWFQKAADLGIADSQYNLGILYARGIGVQPNYAESYKWFSLAANQGDKEAAKKRDEVAAKLDAQALNTARQSIQTWSAAVQPADAVNINIPAGGWDAPQHAALPPKAKPRASSAKAAAPLANVD